MSRSALAIAEALSDIAVLKRLAGENEFKAAAYEKAARAFEALTEPIPGDDPEAFLRGLPGVGESIRHQVLAFLAGSEMPEAAALRAAVPAGLLEWLRIPGLGPKRIRAIHAALGITSLAELASCCADGTVAALPGLGEKSAAKIAAAIAWQAQNADRCRMDEAQAIAARFLARLRTCPGLLALETAGSLRRGLETVGDVDLLATAHPADAPALLTAFVATEGIAEILAHGETKASVRAAEGRQVDLRVVEPAAFPAALLYFTGSKEHNVALRGRARERGLTLNEYGLFPLGAEGEADLARRLPAEDEAALYRTLDLPWIPPELREGWDELDAWTGREADRLVTAEDIQGVLHAHSTWSDGVSSLAALAEACRGRGYRYLGISDHSRAAAYAGGLSIERVWAQWAEIDRLNGDFAARGEDFRIFKGIESDILADGSLDYPDEVLAGFDFVIASVHSGLDQPAVQIQKRLLRALENPFTTLLGHPSGRLLLRRPGAELDYDELLAAAQARRVAVEINANPLRLDLDWRPARRARHTGFITSINPDAHAPDGLDDIRFGVAIARKAWCPPQRVLNTLSTAALAEWFSARRHG
jgi:DNA polymerase (family 10)